jgi:gliding motility-associated lipoprotein GldH
MDLKDHSKTIETTKMNSTKFFAILLGGLMAVSLISCDKTRVYDKMQDLDSSVWNDKQVLEFPIEIKNAELPYVISYTIRYDNEYPYYNLYINRELLDSAGVLLNKKMQGMDLFRATTGVPYGDGMGAKKDYQIISEQNVRFPYPGKYTIKLHQYMRIERLPGLSAVGVRIDLQEVQP